MEDSFQKVFIKTNIMVISQMINSSVFYLPSYKFIVINIIITEPSRLQKPAITLRILVFIYNSCGFCLPEATRFMEDILKLYRSNTYANSLYACNQQYIFIENGEFSYHGANFVVTCDTGSATSNGSDISHK